MEIEVRYTPDFERQLKPLAGKYKSIYADPERLIVEIEETPDAGKPLGKGLFKVRMAISDKAKGKSGGARVITYVLLKNASFTWPLFMTNPNNRLLTLKD